MARDGAAPVRRPRAGWLAESTPVTGLFPSAKRVPDLVNPAGGLPRPATFPIPALATLAEGVRRRAAAAGDLAAG
jgi:hypothetical protein